MTTSGLDTQLTTPSAKNSAIGHLSALSPQALIDSLCLPSLGITLLVEQPGICSGEENMRRDSLLLDDVRQGKLNHVESPVLLLRTYLWDMPTLSLGKNQPEKDRDALLKRLSRENGIAQVTAQAPSMVLRPTGGRAILHYQDISFAFITNAPVFLKLSLKDSYCVFTHWLKETLHQMGYPTEMACAASNRHYLRSPLCFDTHTPSDILSSSGQKLAGCAQARRAKGILQHGSAFLGQDPKALYPEFSRLLFEQAANALQQAPQKLLIE